ncbi:hypothetical protein IPE76_31520, partial [Escherichia coli]|nr:hypothetical protein [Escherichia coli]
MTLLEVIVSLVVFA